jgi:predicted nucleic acid-binding protein
MGQEYLIDTNVISHLFSNRIPEPGKVFVQEVINTSFLISVVVEIEVLTYHEIPEKMPLIEDFIGLAIILQLTKEVTLKTIEIRKQNRKMKLADAIIAATALVHSLILITNNTKDFIDIDGLVVIDPHTITQ